MKQKHFLCILLFGISERIACESTTCVLKMLIIYPFNWVDEFVMKFFIRNMWHRDKCWGSSINIGMKFVGIICVGVGIQMTMAGKPFKAQD